MTTVAKSSPSLEQRIRSAIRTFTNHQKPFTLLDISEKMKKDGNGWLAHAAIVAIARPIADELSYKKSRISVWSAKGLVWAFLYHPESYDSTQYIDRDETASPPPTAIAGHPVLTNRATKTSIPSAAKYVEVPREIWTKAGFKEANIYLIDVGKHSLTLYNVSHGKYVKKAETSTSDIGTVPAAGRFRISPKHLKQVRLTNKKLSFFTYTDKIVVTVNQG